MSTEGQAVARVLTLTEGRACAFAPAATVEIVSEPTICSVPACAPHARGLMRWRGRHLALIDLSTLLLDLPPDPRPVTQALVLAYQCAPGQARRHAAVVLRQLPSLHVVRDADVCDLPAGDQTRWAPFTLACFKKGGQAVAILAAERLFGD